MYNVLLNIIPINFFSSENRSGVNIVLCKSIMRLVPVYCGCICRLLHLAAKWIFTLPFILVCVLKIITSSSNLTLLLFNCRVNDQIVKVNNIDVTNADRKSAAQAIRNCGGIINMVRRD